MKTTHCSLLPLLVTVLAGNSGILHALANSPPTLNAIPNVVLSEDAGNHTIPLAGIGSGAPEEQQTLTLSASSSNPLLIPVPSIQYVSPSATGTLTLTPAANASGTATITVTVNDGQPSDNTVSRSFMVAVSPVNDLPTISVLADQTLEENTSSGPIPFTVGDLETPAASLVVAGSSSNPGLVPATNLVFAGSGLNRTLTVIPASNQFGSARSASLSATVQGAPAVVISW